MAAAAAQALTEEFAAALVAAGVDPPTVAEIVALDHEVVNQALGALIVRWQCQLRSVAGIREGLADVSPHDVERHAGLANMLAQAMAEQRALEWAMQLAARGATVS
jgi:hypothetical protein